MMIHCAQCDRDVAPLKGIGGLGRGSVYHATALVLRCPDCNSVLIEPEHADEQPAAVTTIVSQTTRKQQPKASGSVDVLALAKERLAFCDSEIERLRSFELEARRLRAMIAAAEEA